MYGMELAKEEEGEDGKTTFTYVMKKGGKKASGGGGTPVKKEKKEKKDGPTPTIAKKLVASVLAECMLLACWPRARSRSA